MKYLTVLCAFLFFQQGYAQKTPDSLATWTIKSRIMSAPSFEEWQSAIIAYQKSYRELCRLQSQFALFPACGKPLPSEASKEYVLNLLRQTWKKNDLKDTMLAKEMALRNQFAALDTIFWEEALFPEIYAPIHDARKAYTQENK